MELYEKKIQRYQRLVKEQCVREDAVRMTVQRSKDALESAENGLLTYAEFLYQLLHFIRKRWWAYQSMVLVLLWLLLKDADGIYAQRTMGAGAAIFVILLVPELWKNRRTASMEIEGAAYYSLRQIYSARMLLFAMADLLMLTGFWLTASWTVQLTVETFLINFVLPFTVSCCVCFRLLGSRRADSEYAVVVICGSWAVVWMMILGQDRIYENIAEPVWAGLLICSLVYLGWCVRKAQKDCEAIWEVN